MNDIYDLLEVVQFCMAKCEYERTHALLLSGTSVKLQILTSATI